MPRLFLALDLPGSITVELARILSRPVPGLRSVAADQMHVTLHFIGAAEIDAVIKAVQSVKSAPFTLSIEQVGKFPAKGKANVLWAGVAGNVALVELQNSIGRALAASGFTLESRPYCPHVTLARCGDRVPAEVADDFLNRQPGLSFPPFMVTGFGLYSSTNADGAPIYRREQWFPF